MPLNRPVMTLLDLALNALEETIALYAVKAADTLANRALRTDEPFSADNDEEHHKWLVVNLVDRVQEYVYSCVVWSLYEDVTLKVLKGLESAVNVKKELLKRYDSDSNRVNFLSKQMAVIVALTDMVMSRHLKNLNLDQVPKILRTRLFDNLKHFKGVQNLTLGSGSGGWSDMYIEKFCTGIRSMKFITHFSLCYDCNDDILKILSRNCKNTLRVADLEMSKRVTDVGAKHLSVCTGIVKLHIFHTGISSEGHALLLEKLKHLKVLVRGDFLCEALEHLHQKGSSVQLKLLEFWASEEYYFHDLQQMSLVAQYCPRLEKMMFQYSKDTMSDLMFLTQFNHLKELHLWGGDFYLDRIDQALIQMGHQLEVLYLIHTNQINEAAVMLISNVCPNLVTFGLYNCELESTLTTEERDQLFNPVRDPTESRLRMEKMLEVKFVHLVSDCSETFFLLVLGSVLNLENLKTGIHCHISDSTFDKLLAINSLQHLQCLTIPASSKLTSRTIDLLLMYCPKLRYIRDLEYWEGVTDGEMDRLIDWCKINNLDLDVGTRSKIPEEQKYLDNLPENIVQYLMGKEEDDTEYPDENT